jgi:hypothetical protein
MKQHLWICEGEEKVSGGAEGDVTSACARASGLCRSLLALVPSSSAHLGLLTLFRLAARSRPVSAGSLGEEISASPTSAPIVLRSSPSP